MKKLIILTVLWVPVTQARGLKPSNDLINAGLLAVIAMSVGTSVYISSRTAHIARPSQADEPQRRDYRRLIRKLSIEGAGITNDDRERFAGEGNLSATDYDGLTIYYVQGALHTTGTAIAVPELGSQILLVKKDGAFNQLIHTDQVIGVAIEDSTHLGLPIAVPTEESEYEWQPVPHEITADLEAIIQRGHLIHGDVLQQFTDGQLLVASSYTVDKDGKITPLENPRNIFAPASKVTWFDPEAPIPTATKCEQCHDAEFPNED